MELLRKLQKIFPRLELMTICKAFVRPNLDYDEGYNKKFQQKLKSVQYNACLALPRAIRGSSRDFTKN